MDRQIFVWALYSVLCFNGRRSSAIAEKYVSMERIVLKINSINETLSAMSDKAGRFKGDETANRYNEYAFLSLPYFSLPDCASIYEDGYTESGVYSIWLTTGYRFLPIYCDMETRHPRTNKRGWMVIQRRYNGELNFNRTWQEYVDGFGSPHGEYWIGLENIYQLAGYTKKLHDARSLIIDLMDQSGTNAQANYANFEIFNSTLDYELANPVMISSIPLIENGLLTSTRKKFSTFDKNNQKVQAFGNCAQTTGGGWWFGCGWVNLNARYPGKGEKMSKTTIYWEDWWEINPQNDALINVSMKIQ